MFGTPPSRTTRQPLGHVPQGLGLWETLTVRESPAFAATAFGADAPDAHRLPGAVVLVTTHYMQEAQQCDRLPLMLHGAAVAERSVDDIIGATIACEVDTPDWAAVFAALNTQGPSSSWS
ncbi:hypothetical protein ACFCZY_41900 [Streptomyces sp. NPDC056237]|uniref:hypothetical protein n=1 Tax=unclassified Streptomyces TaxID=2593676 RepID=UPI0035D871DA